MKCTYLKFFNFGIILLVLVFSPADLKSQTPSTTISSEDAITLLTKARDLSNLQTDSTPPFHLVATIETFDFTGQPNGDGTIEEFWDGLRLRRSITYRGATQVYVFAGQSYVSSEPFSFSWSLRTLLPTALNPVLLNPKLPGLVAEGKKVKLGGIDADCVAVTFRDPSKITASPASMPINHNTYCLSADRHLLRLVSTSDGATLIYNNLEMFGPKAVAHDVTMKRADVTRGKLHIKSISSWKADDSTFEPVAGSTSFPPDKTHDQGIPDRVIAGSRISGDSPIYPPSARALRIEGDVKLSAFISRIGTLIDIDVIDSPNKDLAKAAIDALRTWRYSAFLYRGHPVEVETIILVHFGL